MKPGNAGGANAAGAGPTSARTAQPVFAPVLPHRARGLVVLFARRGGGTESDGTVSAVADGLRSAGLGTVVLDPLSDEEEEASGDEHRFDIGIMAERLMAAVDRLAGDRRTGALPVGCVATGTAGAAALRASTERRGLRALVILEGRPDMAGFALERVKAPTLLVVAGLDTPLLRLNHEALRRLKCPALLEVVPGAMHGLHEPAAREMALAGIVDWLCTHLGVREPARNPAGFGAVEHPLLFSR